VVPSDGTHSAVPALLVGGFSTSAAAPFQLVLQFPPALFTVKIAGLGKDNALLPAKGQRTLSHQQHVARSFHNRARGQYRIARAEDARHPTRPMIGAVHHRGVHLLRSGGGEDTASPGIEQRVVLERHNRFCRGIERAAACGKNVATGDQGATQALVIWRRAGSCRVIARNRSSSAMDGKREPGFGSIHRQASLVEARTLHASTANFPESCKGR
jgi:hypothetical protein